MSTGWNTPFFHATVTQVKPRLKRPKPSLNTNQAKLASLLLDFFVVRAGEGGIVGGCCHAIAVIELWKEIQGRASVWGVYDAAIAGSKHHGGSHTGQVTATAAWET